ncbi:MAG TPA: segregation/condensation protein A, partial [Metalysinibacillus sp.]
EQLEEQSASVIPQYVRPATDLSAYMKEEQLAFFDMDVTVYDMLAAFEKMLQRKKWQQPLTTRVARQEIAIKDQMRSVFSYLKRAKGRASFADLFEVGNKSALIATFLSVLELMRQQMIRIEQQQNFEELTVILVQEEWQDEYTAELDYQN